jgi:hypothetical protein
MLRYNQRYNNRYNNQYLTDTHWATHLAMRWPPGPRRSDLTGPAAGPARQFQAFWAAHGEAVQAYVRNGTHELRRTLEELRALQTLYESGYHTQRGMHVVIYEVRLLNIMNALRAFQPTDGHYNSMADVLAASLDLDSLPRVLALPAPLGRQFALLQRALAAHALRAAVLDDFEACFDESRDPLRIWPYVRASIAQLEQFLGTQ